MSRSVGTWLWAAVNAASLTLLLSALPILGIADQELVVTSALVASMQGAQAIIIQNAGWFYNAQRVRKWACLSLFILGLILLFSGSYYTLRLAAAICAGVIFGTAISLALNVALLQGKAYSFQLANAQRSAAILVCAGAAFLVNKSLPSVSYSAALVAFLALVLFLLIGNGETTSRKLELPRLTAERAAVVAFGLVASTVYRNDVNYLRISTTGTAEFLEWHYVLLGYSAFQGVSGMFVLNHIFARRAQFIVISRQLILNNKLVVLLIVTVAIACACLMGSVQMPIVVLLLPALVISAINSLLSSLAHSGGWSALAYIANSVGIVGLMVVMSVADGSARLAWTVELASTMVILIGGIAFWLNRQSSGVVK